MNRNKAGRTPSKHRKRGWRRGVIIGTAAAASVLLVGGAVGAGVASAATSTTHKAVPATSPSNPVSYSVVGGSSVEVDFTLSAAYTGQQVLIDYGQNEGGGKFTTSGSVQLQPGETEPTFQNDCNVAFDVTDDNSKVIQSGTFTVPANCTAPPANHAPKAKDDSATTDENTAVTVDVLANDTDKDGDTLSVATFDSTSAHGGTVTLVSNKLKYTPAKDFTGTDTFKYTAGDGKDGSNKATVTITVNKTTPQCVKATTGNMGATSSDTNASVNPKVNVCATKLYWQEYVVPSTWDGNGFDASAVPQSRVAVDSKTVQGSGKVSFSVALDTTTDQYTYQYGCYVNRQIDLTDVDQTTVDKSGSHGTLYTYVLKRFKVGDKPCNYVPPTPKDASGDFTLTGVCGTSNDVVNVTAVNATAGKPVWNGTSVSVTFTANEHHLFPNGQPTLTVTKDEVDTAACPVPSQPKVEVQADSCVMPGALDGKTLITVTNTADDTHASASYTVAVTEQGKTDVTLHTGPLADGASETLTVLGLQPGDYGVAVTGDDMTGAGTSFVLTACQTPPPPAKTVVSVNIAATGANCGPKAIETYYVGGQLDKVAVVVTVAGKQVSLSPTDSFVVDSGQTWSVVFTVKDSANTELPNGKSTMAFSGKNSEKPFACPVPPKHHQPTPPHQNGPVPHTGFTGTFVAVVTHPYAGLARFLEGVSALGALMLLVLGLGLVRRREASQQ